MTSHHERRLDLARRALAETAVEIGDLVTLTDPPTDVELTLTGIDLDPRAVARFCRAERRT